MQQTPKIKIKIWTVRKETTWHNWMTSITKYKSVLCTQATLCMQWIHFIFPLLFCFSFRLFSFLVWNLKFGIKIHLSLQSLPNINVRIKLLWHKCVLLFGFASKITAFTVTENGPLIAVCMCLTSTYKNEGEVRFLQVECPELKLFC